jgi:Tol biopolymer transport system component
VTLAAGTKLGPYEIAAPLGAGGMGEVYRARDTRLGRDVAVKVLPQHLSANPEVRSRFEREARTVSSLNHPHICVLHDVGREADTDYLVMELVEGETLAQRLTRGALPAPEVLRLGVQIADALERAHRAGVVHRDLKPGNVMLTRAGAKLMDFGLARANAPLGPGGSGASLAMTQSPTVAQPLTAEGTIVGTFQYMAPEQLEGKEADARSDLWALGCVLYEMATGKRAFEGKSQASLIGAIMNTEPPAASQVAPMTPPALDQLVRACLAKDPEERIQTAHDVKLQLQWIAEGGSRAGLPAPMVARRRSTERLAWIAAGILLVATVGLGLAAFQIPRQTAGVRRVAILPPENANINDDEMLTAVSPDGAKVTFVATDSTGVSQLWVRELAASEARPIPGTQQATLPFWSPDSRFIGFFAERQLKKVDVSGKSVDILCDAPDGRGAAWSRRGVIVFAPVSTGGLVRVAEGGGPVAPVTTLDSTRGEKTHRFPSFLPDGVHFLYAALGGGDSIAVRMGSFDNRATRWVMNADGAARYAAPGHVLFARNGTLMVQAFRGDRVIGQPHVLGHGPNLSTYAGSPPASTSANGVVVQRHRSRPSIALAWLNRDGRRIGAVPTAAGPYTDMALSPDDDHAAVAVAEPQGGGDIWTIELARGLSSRLSFDLPYAEKPLWSPDGKWVLFSSLGAGTRSLYRKLANGAGEAELVLQGRTPFTDPAEWSQDGRYFLIRDLDPKTGEDIWMIPQEGQRKAEPLLHSRYHEEDPSLSPDGHWLAYRSNESGRAELYIQSFPTPEAKYRVSPDGAGTGSRSNFGRAFWRKDGRELIYVGGDGVTMLSLSIDTKHGLHVGTPTRLFGIPPACYGMAATSDLSRFLVLEQQSTKESASLQMIVDWPADLSER